MDGLDLGSLLSDPETMGKVMNVVKSLTSSGAAVQSPVLTEPLEDNPSVSETLALPAPEKKPEADPTLVNGAMKIFAEYSKEDDSIRLLRTLKNHLTEAAEVDRAIEVLRLSRSVRAILHMLKGGSHVLDL